MGFHEDFFVGQEEGEAHRRCCDLQEIENRETKIKDQKDGKQIFVCEYSHNEDQISCFQEARSYMLLILSRGPSNSNRFVGIGK